MELLGVFFGNIQEQRQPRPKEVSAVTGALPDAARAPVHRHLGSSSKLAQKARTPAVVQASLPMPSVVRADLISEPTDGKAVLSRSVA